MTYIYVKKITKVMILFEGYKKAVEIYNKYSGTDNGRKTVTWYNNELGVSKEYLVWFTSCIACYNIPLYIVLSAYKDWKRVVSYYKKNGQPIPNIESLNYQQTWCDFSHVLWEQICCAPNVTPMPRIKPKSPHARVLPLKGFFIFDYFCVLIELLNVIPR